LSTYRLTAPYERPPLRRRLSGFGLAVAINLGLLLILMGLGVVPSPVQKPVGMTVVNFLPESRSASSTQKRETQRAHVEQQKPVPKPPPIILRSKATIAAPSRTKSPAWVEMSSSEMAAADISKLGSSGAGRDGDSETVGQGPHGEMLYAAEWARRPTDAELQGYLPPNAQDGYGLIACKTIPGNRVENCVALDQYPLGSHLAAAVLNAAWQFRVRPPRKNGRPMIGEWVSIRIDYSSSRRSRL
jgi:protein TonB